MVEDRGAEPPVVSSFDLGSHDICCQIGTYHHLPSNDRLIMIVNEEVRSDATKIDKENSVNSR